MLQPAGIAESLTVTAARSQERLAATATATAVLPASILLTSAALTADDALRSVPGFSLFRRSSSRVANPTTQGASLRGLAASGASRALVLADGARKPLYVSQLRLSGTFAPAWAFSLACFFMTSNGLRGRL